MIPVILTYALSTHKGDGKSDYHLEQRVESAGKVASANTNDVVKLAITNQKLMGTFKRQSVKSAGN